MFLGVKFVLKGYKLSDSKNKKFMLSRYVTFDNASKLRHNSQQVESMKTKTISQWVENDATPRSPIGLVSFGISPNVMRSGDHVVGLDTEHIEEKTNYLM